MISGVVPQPMPIDQSLEEVSDVSLGMSVDPPKGSPIEVAQKPPETGEVESGGEGQITRPPKAEEIPSLPDCKKKKALFTLIFPIYTHNSFVPCP